MIRKRVVLFRIENLKKRRRRVALVIASELIKLIEQKQRIAASGTLYGIYYFARHSAYICFAVSAYLRLVVYSAQRNTGKFSSHTFGYGLAY